MRMPNQWRDALETGYVTTDMIDACVLTLQRYYAIWTNHAREFRRKLDDNPSSATIERKLDVAMRKARRYARMRGALLATLHPDEILTCKTTGGDAVYARYKLGPKTYLQPLTKFEASKIARTERMEIHEVDSVPCPVYATQDLPSLYTVLSVLATIRAEDIRDAIDTGPFEPGDGTYMPPEATLDENDRKRTIKLERLYLDEDSVAVIMGRTTDDED